MKQWINNIGGRQVSHSISGMRHSKKQQQQHTRQNKKKEKENKWIGDYKLFEEYQSGRDLI